MTAALESRIRARGLEIGFQRVSFSAAGRAPRAQAFRAWLDRGFAADMAYLAKDPGHREDVTRRSPWARSIITVSLSYAGSRRAPAVWPDRLDAPRSPGAHGSSLSEENLPDPSLPLATSSVPSGSEPHRHRPSSHADPPRSVAGRDAPETVHGPADQRAAAAPTSRSSDGPGISEFVSAYAQGQDYHRVLGDRLERLARFVRCEGGPDCEARVLVDSSAILERDHAAAAGIGWIGKNAMVIDPDAGSFLFLGEILTDLELTPGTEMEDLCGSCTRCLDACPTQAIVEPRVIDARRCISYLTIELRDRIDPELRASVGEHLFGCDVCQDVCPWNHRVPESNEESLHTMPGVTGTSLEEAVALETSEFGARFKGSAIARAKRSGFVRNALIVAANRNDGLALRAGDAALSDQDPVVRETAVWALSRGEGTERRAAVRAAETEPDSDVRARMRAALER